MGLFEINTTFELGGESQPTVERVNYFGESKPTVETVHLVVETDYLIVESVQLVEKGVYPVMVVDSLKEKEKE